MMSKPLVLLEYILQKLKFKEELVEMVKLYNNS